VTTEGSTLSNSNQEFHDGADPEETPLQTHEGNDVWHVHFRGEDTDEGVRITEPGRSSGVVRETESEAIAAYANQGVQQGADSDEPTIPPLEDNNAWYLHFRLEERDEGVRVTEPGVNTGVVRETESEAIAAYAREKGGQ
jgi:hypothetical protein